jgi:hypothetical protein
MHSGAPLIEWSVAEIEGGFNVCWVSYRPFLAKLEQSSFLPWASISQVVAFKQDNFTTDTVWLSFELRDRSEVSVPEDSNGWAALLDRLPQMLPGALPRGESWSAVAHPAFVSNATRIYPPPNNSSKPTPLRGAA